MYGISPNMGLRWMQLVLAGRAAALASQSQARLDRAGARSIGDGLQTGTADCNPSCLGGC